MPIRPVSPNAEILLLHEELGPETIQLLQEVLDYTFFSEGYVGEQWGGDEKEDIKRGPWSLQRVPVDDLIKPQRQADVVWWLEREEEREGDIWPVIELGTADPEMPLIVGPRWAFDSNKSGMDEYTLLDGWHRTAAAIRAGIPALDVFVTEGEEVSSPW